MWDRNGSRSPDIPLFGEARPIVNLLYIHIYIINILIDNYFITQDKVINLVVGALTIVVIGGTICISLYFAARREDALIKIIFFSINIILLLISHLVLVNLLLPAI